MVAESLAYYRSGLALLRHVEARQPTQRRFGEQADALWAQFQGELTLTDRIELMLREADAQWPGAFGARTVFDLRGVAEDESFGAELLALDGQEAVRLWKEAPSGLETPMGVVQAIAGAWGATLEPMDLPDVSAEAQLVVAGPSALAGLVERFVGDETLDWAAQVIVVATSPAHRQLAAAAGAIVGSTRSQRILAAESFTTNEDPAAEGSAAQQVAAPDTKEGNAKGSKTLQTRLGSQLTELKTQLKGKSVQLISSEDAAPADLALARELAGQSEC